MNVEITGRHVDITPAIRTYVLKRLRKFDRILGNDASFHVVIDVAKKRHTAEIVLKSKLLDLTGKGQTEDMYLSIVKAVEKLERQAINYKSKRIETKRQKAKEKSVAEKSGVEEEIKAPTRVRRRTAIVEEGAPKRLMSVDEAVVELGESEYPFVVFRNVESGSICVLFRRKDGSLRMIQE